MMSSTVQAPPSRVSSTPPQPAPILKRQPTRRLRTLRGQFLLLAGLILLLTSILTFVSAASLSRATDDLNTINSGSIPSVDAALSITQYIEVIDAQSADFLAAAGLTNLAPCTIAGLNTPQQLTVHDCDEHNIDAETVLVNQQLFEAAHNVTYPGERTAVERITIGLESYLGDIHQMRVDFGLATGKTDAKDPYLQQAYQAYMNASKILHDQISLTTLGASQIPFETESALPSCQINNQTIPPAQWTRGGLTDALDCLSSINYAHLTQAYNDSASFLTSTTWLLAVLCLFFCGLLLFGTGRMMITTHRLINPGLFPATLIVLILSFNVVSLLGSLGAQSSQAAQDGAFKQMVKDDYDSVYYAALLKRYSTDANADESRWLIAWEFNDQTNIQHWQNDWDTNVQSIQSLMQRARANQTWVEEIQPLADMDTYWNQYYSIDPQIRSAARNQSNPNWLHDAEFISTGTSNQAFGNFTNAVDRLSQANRDHYTATLNDAQSALTLSFVLSLVLFPLAGLLAVGGIAIRLNDF
jgi:hypothetical protein